MLADRIKANEELKDMMLQHIFDLKDGSRSRIKTISSLDAQFYQVVGGATSIRFHHLLEDSLTVKLVEAL